MILAFSEWCDMWRVTAPRQFESAKPRTGNTPSISSLVRFTIANTIGYSAASVHAGAAKRRTRFLQSSETYEIAIHCNRNQGACTTQPWFTWLKTGAHFWASISVQPLQPAIVSIVFTLLRLLNDRIWLQGVCATEVSGRASTATSVAGRAEIPCLCSSLKCHRDWIRSCRRMWAA